MKALTLHEGKLVETSSVAEVADARRAGHFVWVALDQDTPELTRLVSDVFGLHPLTIEDVWNERQLPKIEEFPGYLQVLVHGVRQAANGSVSMCELDIVVGADFVLSHTSDEALTEHVRAMCMRKPNDLERGPAWVAHSLLDRLVDDYLPIIDRYDGAIATLEREVMLKAGTHAGKPLLARIFTIKRELLALRRTSLYQREIFLRLSRGDYRFIPPELNPFFRDVHDHFSRVTTMAEAYRELLTGLLEAHLSVQSNRMNEVMKALTLMSTLMLPLTFIAGVYGMNFKHMPELDWRYGYLFALTLMVVVTGAILLWFRTRKWL